MMRGLLRHLAFGPPEYPNIPNLRLGDDDRLFYESLTRGTLISGNPGTGKTRWLAGFLIDYALTFPERPIIVFDPSEALTDDFIALYHGLSYEEFEMIDRRFFLDRPGEETSVVTKPLFSSEYGLTNEELVQKATSILKELNAPKLDRTPVMAIAIEEMFPELARLISVMDYNEYGETWQITEVKKLLLNLKWLKAATKSRGYKAPEAKWYFENEFIYLSEHERELRSFTLRSALGVIEPKPLRARYGYATPGITYKKVIDEGLIYFIGGAELSNQPTAQAWVYWDEYLGIRNLINKRTPHDPKEKPVLLVMDEVYQLFRIPGIAEEIGQISAYYRSRKLQLIMVIQALFQLDEILMKQVWNLGNIVSFAMDNFDDAYKISQQLFTYNPKREKLPRMSETGQPVIEPDRGQYLEAANWLQHLPGRACVMKRYIDEATPDQFVRFIERTRERDTKPSYESSEARKERLFKRGTMPVREALKEVNARTEPKQENTKPTNLG